LDKQTVRVVIVNADLLKNRKDVCAPLRASLSGSGRLDVFRSRRDQALRPESGQPGRLRAAVVPKIYPKAALQTDEMKDMDGIQRDAVKIEIPRPAARQGAARGAVADPAAVMSVEQLTAKLSCAGRH